MLQFQLFHSCLTFSPLSTAAQSNGMYSLPNQMALVEWRGRKKRVFRYATEHMIPPRILAMVRSTYQNAINAIPVAVVLKCKNQPETLSMRVQTEEIIIINSECPLRRLFSSRLAASSLPLNFLFNA